MRKFYWAGKGVITFGEKSYGFGDELPAAMPEETITSQMAKGNVTDEPPTAKGKGSVADDRAELLDQIRELTAKIAMRDEDIEQLRDDLHVVTGERDAARDSLATANKSIEQLTEQLTTPAAPAAPAAPASGSAGPKK